MEKGYLHEVGIGASKGGRKPVLLELKPDSYYAVGLDIDVDGVSYILADITGRVVSEGVKHLGSVLPDDVAAKAAECINEITAEHSIDRSKLLGVGISVPGMVDAETRSILLAPNLNWEDVDLGAMLKLDRRLPGDQQLRLRQQQIRYRRRNFHRREALQGRWRQRGRSGACGGR
jgi:hypothetical protein